MNKVKILETMRFLEKKMGTVPTYSFQYKTLYKRYLALSAEIGVMMPSAEFIRTIEPCRCKSVEIGINTEKGECQFKCTNCGLSTIFCANKEGARNIWNKIVKSP